MSIKQVFENYDRQNQGGVDGYKYCPFCQTKLIFLESGQKPRQTCPGCGFTQYKNPSPVISVIIADKDRILLGKRIGSPGAGKWAIPSGYIEYEDDFISTAILEAKEETGLEIEITSILNVISSFVSPSFHFLAIYLEARVLGGELIARDDLEDAKWFPVSGPLPEMAFQEDVDALEMYAKKEFIGLPVDQRYARQVNKNRESW